MFLKKSVNTHLLQMIESDNAFETFKGLVDMAPDKSAILRAIIGEVPNLSTHDMQEYVVKHQSIHSRLMKADPQGATEASIQPAHLTRLLDGLSTDQQLNIKYIMSSWNDRSRATAKDVFKVELSHVIMG